jgi:DNA-binding protein HU-beta
LNKKELVDRIAEVTNINKTTTQKALNGTLMAIAKTLMNGDTITLVGFGAFSVSKRKSRQGKNPKTGETIKIPAKNVAKFKAGKNLLESIN